MIIFILAPNIWPAPSEISEGGFFGLLVAIAQLLYYFMMLAAEEYYCVLEAAENVSPEKLEELKIKLDELTMPFGENPAYQALLKIKRGGRKTS